jgi:hypothetical protein
MNNTITVTYFGFSDETGNFSCSVHKGDLKEGRGVFLEDFTAGKLHKKAQYEVKKMAGNFPVKVREMKKNVTVIDIIR